MNQHLNGIVQTGIRMNVYQVFYVVQNIYGVVLEIDPLASI